MRLSRLAHRPPSLLLARRLATHAATSPPPPTWLRTALALSSGTGASVTWVCLREAGWGPLARVERLVSSVRVTEAGLVGPRGSKRHVGSHLLHGAVTAASVRALLGPASLPLLGAVTLGSMVLPILTPCALLDYVVERSVVVSAADARAIRGRLEAIDAAGLSFSGHREVDAALFRKLSKAIWLAAAGVKGDQPPGGAGADHISRERLLSAIGALDDDASVRYGDVKVSGRAASSLTCSLFDLYDVDNDGSLSFAEFSCGLITLLSLLELGRGRCDEANALAATFAVLDVDGSGYLEAKELEAWVRVLRRLGGALPQDAHRDAYGFPRTSVESVVAGWLAAADDNDDGKISRSEFAQLGPKLNLERVVARMLPELPG